ncbi:MAG TPA: M15 family metallopeptidase [Pyrinomonadaceae bacterium]|nr:M15 family metallopeptidase [Pyrinomonadaceae bacterium]
MKILSSCLKLRSTSVLLILSVALIAIAQQPKPRPAPPRLRPLIGEYVYDNQTIIVSESAGRLYALIKANPLGQISEISPSAFSRNQLKLNNVVYTRKPLGPEEGATQLKVTPLRPVPDLIKEALAAQPPQETGDFLPTDLVELIKLDPTIKLDIRYATTNNLFGTLFYSQARAFLQRAPAEALVRVNRRLKSSGYGLLVHDGYRPWYVTKVFWDATPDDKKIFVADPSKGSRHNRGAAVDLTLYDLKTGKPIEMVSTYDETTDRAYPNYPGGTSLQRWHRDLLRAAMEAEGFTVYEAEWWHFDYKNWQRYRIGNEKFEMISHAKAQRTQRQSSSFIAGI